MILYQLGYGCELRPAFFACHGVAARHRGVGLADDRVFRPRCGTPDFISNASLNRWFRINYLAISTSKSDTTVSSVVSEILMRRHFLVKTTVMMQASTVLATE